MALLTCTKCKRAPMLLSTGTVTCMSCRISAPSEEQWNAFMKRSTKRDITAFIEALKVPLATLQAVCVMTDDQGLKALVAGRLAELKALKCDDYFVNKEAAAEFQKSLDEMTKHL